MALATPFLRLPIELREQIINKVAENDFNDLKSLFLNRVLYTETLPVFYHYWIPTVAIHTDTYHVHYIRKPSRLKQPGSSIRSRSSVPIQAFRRIFNSLHASSPPPPPPTNIVIHSDNEMRDSKPYGLDSTAQLRDTLAWLNEMSEVARRHVRRIRIPGFEARNKRAEKCYSLHPRDIKGWSSVLVACRDDRTALNAIEESALQENIWTFCQQKIKAFEGFEYFYSTGRYWDSPWHDLEPILTPLMSRAISPRFRKLIVDGCGSSGWFKNPLYRYQYSDAQQSMLQMLCYLSGDRDVSGVDVLPLVVEEIEFWATYEPWYPCLSNEGWEAWVLFERFRQDVIALGFENTRTLVPSQEGGLEEFDEETIQRPGQAAVDYWNDYSARTAD